MCKNISGSRAATCGQWRKTQLQSHKSNSNNLAFKNVIVQIFAKVVKVVIDILW